MPDTTTPTTTPAATTPAAAPETAAGGTEAEIRRLVEDWTRAVRAGDLDAVTARHPDDVVMFDVPPPEAGNRGIDAYRASWPQFFEYLRSSGHFDVLEADVTAGDEVAYVWALLRCGSPEAVAADPERRLRLTLGLRRDEGQWVIAHEHHSFTDRT